MVFQVKWFPLLPLPTKRLQIDFTTFHENPFLLWLFLYKLIYVLFKLTKSNSICLFFSFFGSISAAFGETFQAPSGVWYGKQCRQQSICGQTFSWSLGFRLAISWIHVWDRNSVTPEVLLRYWFLQLCDFRKFKLYLLFNSKLIHSRIS